MNQADSTSLRAECVGMTISPTTVGAAELMALAEAQQIVSTSASMVNTDARTASTRATIDPTCVRTM